MAAEDIEPLEARRGDHLLDRRFEVVQRLGKGSTAVALLVKDREANGRLCVLKVAENPEHNDRIVDEAMALDGHRPPQHRGLLEDPFEICPAMWRSLITYAGPKVDADQQPTSAQGRTLASRPVGRTGGRRTRQRWGEDLLDRPQATSKRWAAPHRDIKPENLGVAPRGDQNELHLVLFDFSLSSAPVRTDRGRHPRLHRSVPRSAAAMGSGRRPVRRRRHPVPAHHRERSRVTATALPTRPWSSAPPTVEASMFDAAAAAGLAAFFTEGTAARCGRTVRRRRGDVLGVAPGVREPRSARDPSYASRRRRRLLRPRQHHRRHAPRRCRSPSRAVSALERADVVTVQPTCSRSADDDGFARNQASARETRGEMVEKQPTDSEPLPRRRRDATSGAGPERWTDTVETEDSSRDRSDGGVMAGVGRSVVAPAAAHL